MKNLLKKLSWLLLAITLLQGAIKIPAPKPIPQDEEEPVIIIEASSCNNGGKSNPLCDEPDKEMLQ